MQLGKYKKAAEQIEMIKASNYNGNRKKEYLENMEILQRKTEHLLGGVVMAGCLFLCACNTFAEGETAEKKNAVDKITTSQAYAMELTASQMPLQLPAQETAKQIQDKNFFYKYINSSSDSRFSEREPTRKELENVPVYRGYYAISDRKDELEEKVTKPINNSKWKDYVGIDKISTKVENVDEARLKVQFKQFKKMDPVILIKSSPKQSEGVDVEGKISFKF